MRVLVLGFILRPLFRERLRTATTIAGVALGVGVVIAIQLANASAVRGFATALDTMSGRASVEIASAWTGLDERRLPELGWLREFGDASPVIEGEMALVIERRPTEAVRVLGIDILRDRAIRDYRLAGEAGVDSGQDVPAGRVLELLTRSDAVVITETLARRFGLQPGSPLDLLAGDRVRTFRVTGLLADEGPARVLDGNFVLLDIAAAQLAFDRLGWIDRLDVRLAEGRDVQAALASIAARLPEGLHAQRPARRGEQVERMLAAFHMNLTALSWIALIVGLFLVYNTVTISVVGRRDEIGMLRAVGVTRGQVLALVLAEAAVLGLAGAALGLGLARVLAAAAVDLTASTVSTLYIATAAAPPALEPGHAALALGIGLPLSLLAAAIPAREAASVPPIAAMAGTDSLETRVRLPRTTLVWPAVLLGLAAWLASREAVNGVPIFAYLSALAVIAGAALLVPALLFAVARLARGPLRRTLGVEGLLAQANFASAIPRLSISVAALAVALSMMVAIAVMIGSFRETVRYWVSQTLQADLFIGPAGRAGPVDGQTLSDDVVKAVSADPQVEAVDAFRHTEITYEDRLVRLGAGSFEIVSTRGALLFRSPADGPAALRRAIGSEAVIVSEAFARKFQRDTGDTLVLPTPAGFRPFRVAGVYYDYSTERGVIVMDGATFARHYGDRRPTGLSVYLAREASPDAVRERILASLDEGHRVFVHTNRSLRAEVLRVFDSTFAITSALEAIAIFVAMLGVAGTLLTLVLERRRDLAILRLVGADRRQVRRMVILEAGLIGVVSQLIGLAMGLALSLVLIGVINPQSFGWTIQFEMPWLFLLQATIAVVAATMIAGLYPARRAADMTLVREG
jgi:putative ABC transport system permease protein